MFPTVKSTTTEAQEGGECDVVSRDADNLTALERRDVVSMRLKPAVSAVHWIRAKDRVFRATVADILTNISVIFLLFFSNKDNRNSMIN